MSWLMVLVRKAKEPRAVRLARKKRRLQKLCRECGLSRSKATQIASRYFNEVAR
ncbi:hypothetical protein [Hydrogenophaga sp. T2]|uniref:hypothetical protein n=1 Tax=Hydrogenophaga sp. T2 TaxID=3132823 RepID=UPI003CEB3782